MRLMSNTLKNFRLSTPFFSGFLVFVLVFALAYYLTYQRYLILKNLGEDEVRSNAARIEREMKSVLEQGFSSTQNLSFLVENYGVPNDFSKISRLILNTNKSVDALELVDSIGVITHVYPLEGNEVLGFNILQDSIGKPGALKTIEKGKYYITGPIDLKQGGSGFVCRTPIYNKSKFAGFAAAVIKLSTLLSEIHLDSLEGNQFSYQLSKVNQNGSEEIFFSSTKAFPENSMKHSISDYNGEWKLYVISNKNPAKYGLYALGGLGLFIAILSGFFTKSMLEQPKKLKKLVDEKTFLLRESEQKFRTFVEQASDGIFVADFNGNILDANIYGVQLFGYSKEELLTKNLIQLATSKDLNNIPIRYSELKKGRSILTERKLLKKDGSKFYGEVSAKKLNDGTILGIVRDVTARKKLELAAWDNLQKFQKAFNSRTIGMAIFNQALRFVEANSYFLELLGFSLSDVKGKTLEELGPIVKQEKSKREKAVKALKEEGKILSMELILTPKGRSEIYLSSSAETYEVDNKTFILATYLDRTEEKKAQLETIRSEEKYRSLVQNASDGIVLTDETGNIIDVNIKFCSIIGYTHNELFGQNVSALFKKSEIVTTPLRFTELKQGKTVKSKRLLQKKDGGQIIAELTVKMLPDGRIQGIVRDITEKEKTEKQIIELQSKMNAAIRIGKIGYWNWDVESGQIDWSEKMYEIYDVAPGTQIDVSFAKSLVHPDDLQMHDEIIESKILKRDNSSFSFRIVHRDRSIKHVRVQMEVTTDAHGNPITYQGTSVDITETKMFEERLEKQNAELIKTNSELDSFVYSASHELRAPLASLLGLVNIMKIEDEREEVDERLVMMENSIMRLDGFIGDIIAYSRNRHLALKKEKVNFNILIEKALEDLWYLKNTNKIRISTKIDTDFDFYSDSKSVSVLLNNFLSNAIKYYDPEKSEPFIQISVKTTSESAVVEIKDNGLGIKKKSQERIFDMFYRDSTGEMGSGIGLFIVKEIIGKLGGTIVLDSEPQIGSTFIISLPNNYSQD